MNKVKIDGGMLKSFIEYGYNSLLLNKKIVNDLNVFPIPDGDTGENMCMTLKGGLTAVKGDSSNSICEIAAKCSSGMLGSARGNSGVIFSQLFEGFSKGLVGKTEVGLNELVTALESGVKQGYLAVDRPTEGTMLTVARETTEALREKDLDDVSLFDFMSELLDITKASVEATPEKLDKLKEASVVDSGGAGLYYIVEGCDKFIHGQTIETESGDGSIQAQDIDYSKFNENSVLEFGYCSEVLLQLTKSKTDIDNFDVQALKDFLNSIGDSLVVVKTGYVIKVHVHTFEPYKLLEYCGRFGEFLKIKIENMTLQNNEVTIQNMFEPKTTKKAERKKYGVVAVASGEGVIDMFKALGADVVIDGGQTNNPPASAFTDAFDEINAETIFVFPNNGNVILAAKQAAKSYKASTVHVIESKSIGEGYAALSMIDLSSEDDEEIIAGLNSEMKNTLTGAVTTATRDANLNGLFIKKDDYVGLFGKDLVCANPIKIRAICELIDKMQVEKRDYAVLIYGKDLTAKEREFVGEYVNAKNKDLEVYEVDGKQSVYDLYVVFN